jgi:hypothetical protein
MEDFNVDINTSPEEKMLQQALKENEDFYDEIKGHYDALIKAKSSGTLQFIEKQTSNLITLKQNKVGIIKEMINVKKMNAEMKIKINAANKKEDGTNDKISQLIPAMHEYLLSNKSNKTFDEVSGSGSQKSSLPAPMDPQEEEDIDALLEARLSNEKSKEEESKEEVQVPQYIYVFDVEKNIYCLDEEYNIVEDVVLPDIEVSILEENGELYAEDDEGNRYDVVEFEEEEE